MYNACAFNFQCMLCQQTLCININNNTNNIYRLFRYKCGGIGLYRLHTFAIKLLIMQSDGDSVYSLRDLLAQQETTS